jgi:hypothetical protein
MARLIHPRIVNLLLSSDDTPIGNILIYIDVFESIPGFISLNLNDIIGYVVFYSFARVKTKSVALAVNGVL